MRQHGFEVESLDEVQAPEDPRPNDFNLATGVGEALAVRGDLAQAAVTPESSRAQGLGAVLLSWALAVARSAVVPMIPRLEPGA